MLSPQCCSFSPSRSRKEQRSESHPSPMPRKSSFPTRSQFEGGNGMKSILVAALSLSSTERSVKSKKTIAVFLMLCGTLLSSPPSYAGAGFVKGTVEHVRTHDATAQPAWAPPRFWFSLNGVTSAGTCYAWINGRILFVSESKDALATVLSAYMAGKEIAVAFDDTQTYVGICRAGYITLGNPPPLF